MVNNSQNINCTSKSLQQFEKTLFPFDFPPSYFVECFRSTIKSNSSVEDVLRSNRWEYQHILLSAFRFFHSVKKKKMSIKSSIWVQNYQLILFSISITFYSIKLYRVWLPLLILKQYFNNITYFVFYGICRHLDLWDVQIFTRSSKREIEVNNYLNTNLAL